ASWLTRLALLGHFDPVVKANANPMGPSRTPRPNHRHPLAPLLLATIAAQIPNNSQPMKKSFTPKGSITLPQTGFVAPRRRIIPTYEKNQERSGCCRARSQ